MYHDPDKIERTDRRIDHDIGQMDRKMDQENHDLDQIARSDSSYRSLSRSDRSDR